MFYRGAADMNEFKSRGGMRRAILEMPALYVWLMGKQNTGDDYYLKNEHQWVKQFQFWYREVASLLCQTAKIFKGEVYTSLQ